MYYHFFGFRTNPFSSIPQSNSIYLPATHQSLLNRLLKDLNKKKGISLLLGPAGVGKTSFVKRFITDHSSQGREVALKDLSTHINLLAAESGNTVLAVEEYLTDKLSDSDQQHVLLLDQTDNVGDDVLEKLFSIVSKRNKNNQPTLLILAGLPQLESRLNSPQLQPYKLLLNRPLTLKPLNQSAVKDYILHRLDIAGYSKKSLFTDDAIQSITKLSKGIPQTINILCGNSLFQASLDQAHIITKETVNNATEFFFLEKDTLKDESKEISPPTPASISLPTNELPDNKEKTIASDEIITQSLQEITQMLSEVSQIDKKTSSTQDVPHKPILEQQTTEEKKTAAAKLLEPTILERSGADASRKRSVKNSNSNIPASTFETARNTPSQPTLETDTHANNIIPNQPNSNDKHIAHIYKISLVAISVLLSIVAVIWILKSQFTNENKYNTGTDKITSIAKTDKSKSTPQYSQPENITNKVPQTIESPPKPIETIAIPAPAAAAEKIRPESSEQPAQPTIPPATNATKKTAEIVPEVKITTASSKTTLQTESESTKTKISALFSLAQVQEKNNRLTQPTGNNVIETLQRILKLDHNNTVATQEIQRIKKIFIRQAEQAVSQGQWQKAETSFIKAQRIDPIDSSIVNSLADIRQQNQPTTPSTNQTAIPNPAEPVEQPKLIRAGPDSLELAAEVRAAARYKLSLLGIPYNFESFLTAAENGDDTRLKLFLDANMPVNAQDSLRNTALIKAATQGHLSVVKTLLKKKPAINWQNQFGKTALMLAAEKNQIDIVRALLMRGANKDLEDVAGQTALSIAQRNHHHKVVFLLRSVR